MCHSVNRLTLGLKGFKTKRVGSCFLLKIKINRDVVEFLKELFVLSKYWYGYVI